MAAVRSISSVEDFEEQFANQQPPANVSFRLRPTSSLLACTKLKLQVQAGNTGFRLRNPEMLDCKVRAYQAVEDGMEQLIRECTQGLELQIDDANVCITRLKALIRTGDADMPHRGTALVNRGKGLHQFIHRLPAQPNPFWEYDQQQQGVVVADATQVVQQRCHVQDIQSQRKIWRINLEAQEKRKELMTEYTYAIGRAMRELKRQFLEEETEAGSGYADFRLLHRADQADYAQP